MSTLAIIPSSSTSAEKQYRDPARRKECQEDELSVPGSTIRVGSALPAWSLLRKFEQFSVHLCPLLCMIGLQDVVVDNAGSLELMEVAASSDKTLKEYDALHGLLCEPEPLMDTIHADILTWLNERHHEESLQLPCESDARANVAKLFASNRFQWIYCCGTETCGHAAQAYKQSTQDRLQLSPLKQRMSDT